MATGAEELKVIEIIVLVPICTPYMVDMAVTASKDSACFTAAPRLLYDVGSNSRWWTEYLLNTLT